MIKSANIIGAGISGISTSCFLASQGVDITVFEKNASIGGRARQFTAEGFTFDMGPSWYWMPDVFDKFFSSFGKSVSDYYELLRLDPSYRVFFGENDWLDMPAGADNVADVFESIETGAGEKLVEFLKEAAFKYDKGMNDLVRKPSLSVMEFASPQLMVDSLRLDVFSSIFKHIRKYFKDERIVKIMEFPVLFLGALPENTPALYSLMNYADISLGTWYPLGGMSKVIEGMTDLAKELGVKFELSSEIERFTFEGNNIGSIGFNGHNYASDVVVNSADYAHTESLLPKGKQSYSSKYWDSRVMAPSCLLFYLGVDKKVKNLEHHNLFFDKDLRKHANEIYENPKWPDEPLFYVCAPSKTDDSVAPEGKENLFMLMPLAVGVEDSETLREEYFDILLSRLEKMTGENIRDHILYKRSYCLKEFKEDYHAFKGNAYGLANTLTQTAILKPSIKSKKVNNLYHTGQLTVPGPGMPPALISGEIVANYLTKY